MYIFLDIGGTKTRVGVSYTGEKLDAIELFETEKTFVDSKRKLVGTILIMTKDQPIKHIVCGLPGTISRDGSKVVKAPNLAGWSGIDIKRELEKELSTTVTLCNDTALVGLGEATFGAGKGKEIVCYITISTGVGGVRIVDGTIDRSYQGFEIGHQLIEGTKTLEDLISGTAMQKKYGKHPREVLERSVWLEQESIIARALSTTIYYWSPECIVLGGSMMKSISLTDVTSKVKAIVTMYETLPPLLYSTLGEFGGLYGGLAFIQKIEKDSAAN
jgi:glucokinase